MPYIGSGSLAGAADKQIATEAVEYKPSGREKLRAIGYMMQQVEEMRANAKDLELFNIEEILDSACQEMLLSWAKLRKENR